MISMHDPQSNVLLDRHLEKKEKHQSLRDEKLGKYVKVCSENNVQRKRNDEDYRRGEERLRFQ
jgi:hypothetical protein